MSRTRSRRRRTERHTRREWTARQTQVLLLIGSFAIGAALEWLREQPRSSSYGPHSDIIAILLAAWASVSLLAWWPGGEGRRLPGAVALMLVVLFVGTLITHELIGH